LVEKVRKLGWLFYARMGYTGSFFAIANTFFTGLVRHSNFPHFLFLGVQKLRRVR